MTTDPTPTQRLYSEQEVAELRAELERTNSALANWQEACVSAQNELERVKRQAAAMQTVLRKLQPVIKRLYSIETADNLLAVKVVEQSVEAALSKDAGRDYLSREQVSPLVEALKKAENAIQRVAGINDETRLGWALKDVDAALNHAKTLGL